MQKTINHIFEAAKSGGFEVKEITANKSGITVLLEKDYTFSKVYFEPKNMLISDYLTAMMDKHNRSLGITLNKY